MKDQNVDFFEYNGLFNERQFGFRKGKSAVDALLRLASVIYEGFNERGMSLMGSYDLRKAFDCINHDILFKKLREN